MNLIYFTPDEFDCNCGNCEVRGDAMDEGFLAMLDAAREHAGIPFVINRGVSCEAHNIKVGGSETSSHLTGTAVDIAATTSRQRFLILDGLLSAGISRIGIGETYIHADNDAEKPQELAWLY